MDFPRVSKSAIDLLPSVGRAARLVGAAILFSSVTAGLGGAAQAAVPAPDPSVIKPVPLVMHQAGTPSTMHAEHWSHSSHSSHSSHYSHYSSG